MIALRFVRAISSGGMGDVYEARLPIPFGGEVPVAVKLVRGDTHDLGWQSRFTQEAETSLQLSGRHPNLLATHWCGTWEGRPCVVMELAATSVAELRRGGPLEPSIIRRIARDMLRALDFLHGQGFLHCDVACGNIMIAQDGRVLLGDFGLVRRSGAPLSGPLRGTAEYAAPELFRRCKPTRACDAYSLGAVLYTLLTGHPPYGHGDARQVMHSILAETPLERLPDDVSPDFRQLVDGLIYPEPDKRLTISDALIAIEAGALACATDAVLAALVAERVPDHSMSDAGDMAALAINQRIAAQGCDVQRSSGEQAPSGRERGRLGLAWLLTTAISCIACLLSASVLWTTSGRDGEKPERAASSDAVPAGIVLDARPSYAEPTGPTGPTPPAPSRLMPPEPSETIEPGPPTRHADNKAHRRDVARATRPGIRKVVDEWTGGSRRLSEGE